MSRPRLEDWQGRIVAGDTLTHAEVEELLTAWHDDLEDADNSMDTTLGELEEAREEIQAIPEWGNCKRGCPPAYLDREGFCSPACTMGAPRGEFVTAPANDAQETILWREQHGF